jgi:hypothetical protein
VVGCALKCTYDLENFVLKIERGFVMNIHDLKPIQISGVSAAKLKRLVEQLGHLGLAVTSSDQGYHVTGQDLAGDLSHDSATDTLTVALHQVPPVVTPGQIVGRLYDEILSTNESEQN